MTPAIARLPTTSRGFQPRPDWKSCVSPTRMNSWVIFSAAEGGGAAARGGAGGGRSSSVDKKRWIVFKNVVRWKFRIFFFFLWRMDLFFFLCFLPSFLMFLPCEKLWKSYQTPLSLINNHAKKFKFITARRRVDFVKSWKCSPFPGNFLLLQRVFIRGKCFQKISPYVENIYLKILRLYVNPWYTITRVKTNAVMNFFFFFIFFIFFSRHLYSFPVSHFMANDINNKSCAVWKLNRFHSLPDR